MAKQERRETSRFKLEASTRIRVVGVLGGSDPLPVHQLRDLGERCSFLSQRGLDDFLTF